MKLLKLFVFFIIFVTVIGCASSQKPTVVDPVGRRMPTPHYVLRDMRGHGIEVLFYYTLYDGVKDVDGTTQSNPIYLEIMKTNEFAKGAKVVLTMEVHNPNKQLYELWERVQIVKAGKEDAYPEARGGRIAASNLTYRQFVYELSTDPSLKTVSYGIDLFNDKGEMLLHIGKFNYLVSNSNVISTGKTDTKEAPIIHNVKGGKGLTQEQMKDLNKN
jgi:hypothetical protein